MQHQDSVRCMIEVTLPRAAVIPFVRARLQLEFSATSLLHHGVGCGYVASRKNWSAWCESAPIQPDSSIELSLSR